MKCLLLSFYSLFIIFILYFLFKFFDKVISLGYYLNCCTSIIWHESSLGSVAFYLKIRDKLLTL